MTEPLYQQAEHGAPQAPGRWTATELIAALARRWRMAAAAPLLGGAAAVALSFLIPPTFTAKASYLPPAQQQQGGAASALASLGALAGLGGGGRNSGDQYLAFTGSRTVADRLIDRFDLLAVYDVKLRDEAVLELRARTRLGLGKKDGVVTLEVDDHDPKRAAALAAAYLDEVQRLTSTLALTEAKQRRIFFEAQLKQVRIQLDEAQAALQATGINGGAIKAEPKATAESFAKLKLELTTAEVRLGGLRQRLTEQAPEVQQQTAIVSSLRAALEQLAKAGNADEKSPSYIGAYRAFKYQESLFDLMARQYELARIDESREGSAIQVIDAAQPPEKKSRPKRSLLALLGMALAFAGVVVQTAYRLGRQPR